MIWFCVSASSTGVKKSVWSCFQLDQHLLLLFGLLSSNDSLANYFSTGLPITFLTETMYTTASSCIVLTLAFPFDFTVYGSTHHLFLERYPISRPQSSVSTSTDRPQIISTDIVQIPAFAGVFGVWLFGCWFIWSFVWVRFYPKFS